VLFRGDGIRVRLSTRVKIGVAAAVVAALAILAGTAWLAVVAASDSRHHAGPGSLVAPAVVPAGVFRVLSVTPSPGAIRVGRAARARWPTRTASPRSVPARCAPGSARAFILCPFLHLISAPTVRRGT
jgi:hypothetical protein